MQWKFLWYDETDDVIRSGVYSSCCLTHRVWGCSVTSFIHSKIILHSYHLPDMLVGPVDIGVSRADDVSTSLCPGRSLSLSFHQLRAKHVEPDSSNITDIYSSWNKDMFLLNKCLLNRNWLQTTIPRRYVSLHQWWLIRSVHTNDGKISNSGDFLSSASWYKVKETQTTIHRADSWQVDGSQAELFSDVSWLAPLTKQGAEACDTAEHHISNWVCYSVLNSSSSTLRLGIGCTLCCSRILNSG